MENYQPTYSYPDSGGSSPRSRDVDFDNVPPPSWEDHTTTLPPTYKVKFMVSYGGKIQPRPHDNLLSYVGGDTKILALDRSVKFSTMHTKLATLFSNPDTAAAAAVSGFTVKYQLPGEDLDALISVTNDDDLEHMMHEYDRMWRGSSKSVRLRLFLFNESGNQWRSNSGGSLYSSAESEGSKIGAEPETGSVPGGDKFVDELISNHQPQHLQRQQQRQQNDVVLEAAPPPPPPPRVISPPVQLPVHNNVDFLFGLEKGPVQVPGPVHVHEPVRLPISAQELHQFKLREQQQQQQQQQQQTMYFPKIDEGFGEINRNSPTPANFPAPATAQMPAGYWQQVDHQPPQQPPQFQQHQQYRHPPPPQQPPQQQPVYMMHAPPPPQGGVYHAPMMRGQIPPNQGYFQPMYSTPAPAPAVVPAMSAAAGVRPGMSGESAGYQQVAYDGVAGRQVYYAAGTQGGGGVVGPPYPGMAAVAGTAVSSGEMRISGDGKGGNKGGINPNVL